MTSKTNMVELYRPSRRVLDWLAENMSFGLALEGIASGDLYYVIKLKDRKRVEAARARKALKMAKTVKSNARQGSK